MYNPSNNSWGDIITTTTSGSLGTSYGVGSWIYGSKYVQVRYKEVGVSVHQRQVLVYLIDFELGTKTVYEYTPLGVYANPIIAGLNRNTGQVWIAVQEYSTSSSTPYTNRLVYFDIGSPGFTASGISYNDSTWTLSNRRNTLGFIQGKNSLRFVITNASSSDAYIYSLPGWSLLHTLTYSSARDQTILSRYDDINGCVWVYDHDATQLVKYGASGTITVTLPNYWAASPPAFSFSMYGGKLMIRGWEYGSLGDQKTHLFWLY
jgi:hypothetical protein